MSAFRPSLILVVAAMALSCGCRRECAGSVQTDVRVHVPESSFTPRHCASQDEESCRTADEVVGLTHIFRFERHAEGRIWCSFADPPGMIRTRSCDPARIRVPEPNEGATYQELNLVVGGCNLIGLSPPRVGDACGVLSQTDGPRIDSCAPSLVCRASDSTCVEPPAGCELDVECNAVQVCDETHLCVRFACDSETSRCVWPDECLDTTDCERSHSRCDPHTGRCQTFTCETGRCVGAGG